MKPIIFTKTLPPPEIDIREILRYAGERGSGEELLPLVKEAISEAEDKLVYRVCYTVLPISVLDGRVCFGDALTLSSNKLCERLSGCDRAAVFAATGGIEMDRLIKKSGVCSPLRALIFQALGAERVEALCDAFCDGLRSEFGSLTPRFSPGYSDLSLFAQRDVLTLLDSEKSIGLTLNESLLMSPTKSVSAIVGIRKSKL